MSIIIYYQKEMKHIAYHEHITNDIHGKFGGHITTCTTGEPYQYFNPLTSPFDDIVGATEIHNILLEQIKTGE